MEFSIFYAKLIGFYCVLVTIGMFVNRKNIQPFILDMTKNNAFIILTGLLSLLFGLAIVLTHNVWFGWPIIITIIGYLSIIRGIIRVYFTDWFAQFASRFSQTKSYNIMAIIVLILGVILLYFGYMPI